MVFMYIFIEVCITDTYMKNEKMCIYNMYSVRKNVKVHARVHRHMRMYIAHIHTYLEISRYVHAHASRHACMYV